VRGHATDPDLRKVQVLIQAGANPNFSDDNGLTPLHICACKKQMLESNIKVIEALLDAVPSGADPLLRDAGGNTALHSVCDYQMLDVYHSGPGNSLLRPPTSSASPSKTGSKMRTQFGLPDDTKP
jgi:hypothetical protein